MMRSQFSKLISAAIIMILMTFAILYRLQDVSSRQSDIRFPSRYTRLYSLPSIYSTTLSLQDLHLQMSNIPIKSTQSQENVSVYTQIAHSLPDHTRTDESTPYMIALHIAEQLTMSTSHFIEFLNMAYLWNLTAVEPFVYKSRMFALRSMHPADINGSVYYHRLLDTSFINKTLSKCLHEEFGNLKATRDIIGHNRPLFVTAGQFLKHSERGITLVYFSRHVSVLGKELHASTDLKLSDIATDPIFDCSDVLKNSGMSESVENLLNREINIEGEHCGNFTVVQAFCVMPKVELSLAYIREYVLSRLHRDRSGAVDSTVVFVSWQGKFTRSFIDVEKEVQSCTLPSNQIPPSREVISATNEFLNFLGLQPSSYIAVHIRFEKLFGLYDAQRDSERALRCCMRKLDAVLKQIKAQISFTSRHSTSTLLLHDYGRYGSDVCHYDGRWTDRGVCVNESQRLLSILNEANATEFDPLKFGVPDSSGFASRVESVSLTGGQFLIVIGGGSYQKAIENRFQWRKKTESRAKKGTAAGVHEEGVAHRLCDKVDEKLNGIDLTEISDCYEMKVT